MTDYQTTNEAFKGSLISLITYLFLSIIKLIASFFFNSPSLRADGFNNLSDVISSTIIALSLYIANRPADNNHRFGHQRYETIGSTIASFIMLTLGLEVITSSFHRIIQKDYMLPNSLTIIVSIGSLIFLFISYLNIKKIALRTKSIGLRATTKDMKNDMLISVSTIIGTVMAILGYPILDNIVSLLVGLVIIYSAYEIFSESSFALSDGFDTEALLHYKEIILQHERVFNVSDIRGRLSGQLIYLDIVIEVNAYLTVREAHDIADDIENELLCHHGVHDVDIHIEPFIIEN